MAGVVQMYRAYRIEDGRIAAPALIFEAHWNYGRSSPGKLARVTLDAFRTEKDALPSFVRPARPGLASSAVRRGLGEPATVVHHTFFGIEVSRPGLSPN
jgi:hypothetical protein